jgi:hypothetical protein
LIKVFFLKESRALTGYGNTPVFILCFIFENLSDAYFVPNIVHFIYFRPLKSNTSEPMSFLNHVSYISVYRFIRPRYIFVYGNAPPHGDWWDRTISNVSNIYFVDATRMPTRGYGTQMQRVEHR